MIKIISFIFCGLLTFNVSAQVENRNVFELMDLQIHLTMHSAYSFFSDSLVPATDHKISKLTNKHLLKNVIYANLINNHAGARILIHGAIASEFAKNKNKIRNKILDEINLVNEFVTNNSDQFIVARTPEEVREFIFNTKKTVILHSIEGANHLIHSQEDADFWAAQGVSFVTLIHLIDSEYGGAAINKGFIGSIMNPKGSLRKLFHSKHRGLTEIGKNAIRYLSRAGVMTDLSHMSPDALNDALDLFSELNLPPLVTHSAFGSIQKHDYSLSKKQLLKIYELGGLYSLPIAGESHVPDKAEEDYLMLIKDKKLCPGSLDSYRWAFEYVEQFLLQGKNWSELNEEDQINLSLGWQSDFNGWLNHSRPRFGKRGCYPLPAKAKLTELETKGLSHPGMMADYWRILRSQGMNVDSLKASTEKFLRIWEKLRSQKL